MSTNAKDVRRPAASGHFYPASPTELTKQIATLFAEVDKPPVAGPILGLIVPHAGYVYSGRTAAKAYKAIVGEEYDSVIVISPSHTVFFQGSSVYDGDGYQTPLGIIPNDRELAEKLAQVHPAVYLSKQGHSSGSTRGEHALEVQLPFLQIALGNFKMVAVVMGDQEESSINALGEALAAVLSGKRILLVASTDLSHFHSEKKAARLDMAFKEAIQSYDSTGLVEMLEDGKTEACGGGPTAAVMKATKRNGGEKVQFIEYTHSGMVTGDSSEVVGYLSALIVGGSKIAEKQKRAVEAVRPKKPDFILNDRQKEYLKGIARDAITAHLAGKKYTPPADEELNQRHGAFVTITLDGELRGCIGQIKGRIALFDLVAEMAVAAAFDDPRFVPMTEEESKRAEIEISVLSPLERVHDFSTIEIGKHGLLIKLEMHSGLLLPQVATDYAWDRVEFLEQTCLKAGLPKNSYKEKIAEIYKFTAQVF